MPIARFVRHSPSYLYLKLYSLSVLVSLFASAPVSTRLSAAAAAAAEAIPGGGGGANTYDTTTRWIERVRAVAEEGVRRRSAELRRLTGLSAPSTSAAQPRSASLPSASSKKTEIKSEAETSQGHPFAFALKTLASDADSPPPSAHVSSSSSSSSLSVSTRVSRVLRRWGRRVRDMSEVRGSVKRDAVDIQRFPELTWQAHVRKGRQAHDWETAFVEARKNRAAEDLAAFLAAEEIHIGDGMHGRSNEEQAQESSIVTMINPADVPTVAVGGSGGGYRAMFGFAAALAGLQRAGAWSLITWLGGVSGSCWTIAGLYTIASLSPVRLLAHYRAVAREGHHPMSRQALDVVARSRQGVYFLLAPLLAKARSRVVGVGIMDLYATMTTCYQLLSRSPHARPRLARATFQFSKVWQRFRLGEGQAPLPIFSAVRVMHQAPESSPQKREKIESTAAVTTEEQQQKMATGMPKIKSAKLHYQWWEATPLEVGSSDAGAWVPTWAYGRSFVSGKSVSTAPEISLALLLGQATSAPAGPLTGYISTLLATLPRGTIMSTLLARLNDFVMHRRWQKRWGNPIRGADEPNPLYGIGTAEDGKPWEAKGRIKLMDGGLSNNLPNHIFTTEARKADVIVSFDQSSDVQTGASIARLADFARERQLLLVPDGDISPPLPPLTDKENGPPTADEIRKRFNGKQALIFRGWKMQEEKHAGMAHNPAKELDLSSDPDMYLVYCPLLPHPCQPDFDPVTAPFSTSYNLVWTSEQVETIARTAQANVVDYVVPALRKVMREAYEANRRRRLAREQQEQHDIERTL